jgi:hypothetical protein
MPSIALCLVDTELDQSEIPIGSIMHRAIALRAVSNDDFASRHCNDGAIVKNVLDKR